MLISIDIDDDLFNYKGELTDEGRDDIESALSHLGSDIRITPNEVRVVLEPYEIQNDYS
jgi:hypothetical protein